MGQGCSPTTRRRRWSQPSGTQRRLSDQRNHASSNPRKTWCSLHFLTARVWCTVNSYRLDRLLIVISKCKFCRGCAMQLGGNGAKSGRESGFCITITHRATHRLLCSKLEHLWTDFITILRYQIWWKSIQWSRFVPFGLTDGQTDTTKRTVAFRNFANATKEKTVQQYEFQCFTVHFSIQ